MAQQKTKFNIFQTGILQPIFSVSIGIIILVVGQSLFVHIYSSGMISEKIMTVIAIIASSVVVSMLVYVFMKLSFNVNLTWRVTLPKVIEFSSALRELNILELKEQIKFVIKQNIPVFVADTQIPEMYLDNVRVKMYKYLANEGKIKSFIGGRMLCLDAEDYERVIQAYKQRVSQVESAALAEKDREIALLQGDSAVKTQELLRIANEKDKEIEQFEQDKKALVVQSSELKDKLPTAPGRKTVEENREAGRAAFWRIAGPIINQMVYEAKDDTRYTNQDIQAAFEKELENHPALKPDVIELLATAEKTANRTPFDLKGWGLRAIRAGLHGHIKEEKRPRAR